MPPRRMLVALVALAAVTDAAAAADWQVCPGPSPAAHCDYHGMAGLQHAVDRAADGDTIRLQAGRYVPVAVRDVPYQSLTIRGAVLLDGRRLTLAAEPGVLLDGTDGPPSNAIVVRGGRVSFTGFTLRNFRYGEPEDATYDGHGLFLIDAEAEIDDVTISGVAKMAVTARGTSKVRARHLQILDGHVGLWLEETARVELDGATVRNNDSAGLCAYGRASAVIRGSTFEGNRDDGIYTAGEATVEVVDSAIVGNAPYGLRAAEKSRIRARGAMLEGNATAATAGEGEGRVTVE